jgi:hypothetical protein
VMISTNTNLMTAVILTSALGFAATLPLGNSSHAAIGFEVLLTDTTSSATSTTFVANAAALPTISAAPLFTFAGYTFRLSLDTNYPGQSSTGTLSTQVTFSTSSPGAGDGLRMQVFAADSATPSTKAVYTLPAGIGFSLLGSGSLSSNSTATSMNLVTTDLANLASVSSPIMSLNGSSTESVGLSSLAGYTLENDLLFSGVIAGSGGLSGLIAQTTSSVQVARVTTPEPVSLAVIGVGIAGLGLTRRRKQAER